MQARALLFTAANQMEVTDVSIPEPGSGEVLVEIAYSCISPGTELRNLGGGQAGVNWPFIPGYAASGTIIQRGPDTTISEGTPVFCGGTARVDRHRLWGGHVSHAVCAEKDIYVLPEGVDLLEGSLTRQSAIAYHGVRFSHPHLHEKVAVIGLGLIGQLSARLHTLTGANVVAVDMSQKRVETARRGGVTAYTGSEGLVETFRRIFPEGADIIVDATGSPAVLQQATGIARDVPWDDSLDARPRYIIQGSYPGDFAISYGETFAREFSFLLPRDMQPRDMRAVLDLMSRGKFQVRDLISAIRTPEEAATTYQELQGQSGLLTAAFAWK